MPLSIPAEVREKAKHYLHRNLLEIMDLRRTDYAQLQGGALRKKVEGMVAQSLEKFEPQYQLAKDSSLICEIVDEAVGLGPLEVLLRDPSITEIMVNGHKQIYVEKNGKIQLTPTQFVSEASLRTILGRIVSPLGRRIDESSPMVDARLADGSRVNAIIPPLALHGPTLTIRKFSKEPISISRLISFGSITEASAQFLKMAVQSRKNILIAGGTGSGKTTLLNALAGFIPTGDRILTIEDAAELRLPQEHVVSLEARPSNTEGKGQITIRDLVRNALRMRPDRIVVGECRGSEALDMLQAMNTGHDGSLTTIHANSPRDALLRLETMVLMAGFDLPLRAIREQEASAIQLIAFISRFSEGKRGVMAITEVCGTEDGTILTQDLFRRKLASLDSPLLFTGRLPKFTDSLPPLEREQLVRLFSAKATPHDIH